MQCCTAAASWWISQSCPDRPSSLVNPTSLDSALGALDCKYMSEMSQIVSDDHLCLCEAGQWDRVTQCQPLAGYVAERRSRLLQQRKCCHMAPDVGSLETVNVRGPDHCSFGLFLQEPEMPPHEVAGTDFQERSCTVPRPAKRFNSIYAC